MKRYLIKTLLLLVFFTSCSNKKRTDLNIIFDRVDNVVVGTELRMHGYTIGEVTSLKLLDRGVLVGVRVNQKIKIPIGSEFTITSSLIGASTINVEPSATDIFLTQKDTANGIYQTKGLLDDLVSDSLARNKMKQALNKINAGIKEFIEARRDSTKR